MTEDSAIGEVGFQVPILLILRELDGQNSLLSYLASVFRLPIQHVETTDTSRSEYVMQGDDAGLRIAELLDELRAVLVVDGLDELSPNRRVVIERELRILTRFTRLSKVIVSCRSGDYNRALEGFSVFEIMPLSENEISEIAGLWIKDPERFLTHLDTKPYRDVADRPLLLSFLIFLFQNEGSLPARPSLIYRKVVYRLLRDWDDERGIARGSAYANFDPDIKIDFLSEFSYLLTYQLRNRGFYEDEFLLILKEIGESYDLPATQHTQILREVETHTGIIVGAGFDRFEFAHLSVQEYLCANFIARSPVPDLLKEYLAEYPAPVAVACAISSQPDLFIQQMFRRHLIEKFQNPEDFFHRMESENQLVFDLFGADTGDMLYSFLSRLELERPVFRGTENLGEALLLIYAFYYRRYSKRVDDILDRISGWDNCRAGLRAYFAKCGAPPASRLTSKTAAVVVDRIFHSVYEEVAGPWPVHNRKADILPLAMVPSTFLKEVSPTVKFEAPSKDLAARLRRNLSATPLCEIEFGKHRRTDSRSSCDVCGHSIPRPMSGKQVTRPRKERH